MGMRYLAIEKRTDNTNVLRSHVSILTKGYIFDLLSTKNNSTVGHHVYLLSPAVLCVTITGVLEAGLSPLPVTAYSVMVYSVSGRRPWTVAVDSVPGTVNSLGVSLSPSRHHEGINSIKNQENQCYTRHNVDSAVPVSPCVIL